MKRFRRIVRWGFLITTAAVLVYGVSDLCRYTFRSDLFLVRKVRLQGNFLLTDTEILEALKIPSRIRLWQVRPPLLEGRLLELNLIRSAEVRRMLPQTLLVDISERTPIADWKDPRTGKTYAVDEEGTILCEVEEMRSRLVRMKDVSVVVKRRPVVTGLRTWGLMPGDRLEEEGFDKVLSAFGLAVSRNENWVGSVRTVALCSDGRGWVFRTGTPGIEIRLGKRDFVERVGLVQPIWRFLRKENLVTQYIDLRFREQGVLIRPTNCDDRHWVELAGRYPEPIRKEGSV